MALVWAGTLRGNRELTERRPWGAVCAAPLPSPWRLSWSCSSVIKLYALSQNSQIIETRKSDENSRVRAQITSVTTLGGAFTRVHMCTRAHRRPWLRASLWALPVRSLVRFSTGSDNC